MRRAEVLARALRAAAREAWRESWTWARRQRSRRYDWEAPRGKLDEKAAEILHAREADGPPSSAPASVAIRALSRRGWTVGRMTEALKSRRLCGLRNLVGIAARVIRGEAP